MDRARQIQELIDKQAIRDLINTYCRAADRLDRKLLESLYWPEAIDDHGLYVGGPGGFADFAEKALGALTTQHFIGNILIDMESPTRARAETYVIAFHQGPTKFHGEEFVVGGRYLDKLEKRGSEWRFIQRTMSFDYTRTTSTTPTDRYDGMEWVGAKAPGDPIHRLFKDTVNKISTSTDAQLQDVIDKQAITDVIMRYCRGVDRQDRKAFESVYWPDATDDHGVYTGPAQGFVDFAMDSVSTLKTQHLIGNVLIELESPTTARAESYVTAFHQAPSHFGGQEFVVGARYIDKLEKRGDEWRFKHRTLAYDYNRATPTTETGRYDHLDTNGKKHPDDLSYSLFKNSAGENHHTDKAQEAIDRMAINEVVMRYARGIDRLDRKLLETVYWPDATDNHGAYVGKAPGFIDWVLDYLKPMKTQHFMGNVLIEFDSPTTAHGETYVLAYHQIKTRFGAEELAAGARYVDKFEKRGDEWRFSHRTVCIDYSRRTAATETDRYDQVKWKGGKFPADPIYHVYG